MLAPVAAVVDILRSHDDLGRLFADFLEEGIRPLMQQPRDVAGIGIAALGWQSTFDHAVQSHEGVGRCISTR